MNKEYLLTIALIAITFNLNGQNYKDSLSMELDNLVNKSEISGFGVSIVALDFVLYKKG